MVASVIDGETLKLTDGRTVRLIGAKRRCRRSAGGARIPGRSSTSAEALAALAANRPVELKPGGSRLDRCGHLLAQVFVVTGGTRLWLQDAHRRGTRPRLFLACVTELLAREAEARASLGVWSSSLYRVVSALDVKRSGRLTHSYQVVEGTVATVGEGGGRIYLNFAKDWHSDFTISVDRKDAPAFAAAGIDLKALAGKRLRVRGFLGWRMADDRSEPSGADRALAGRFQARHAAAAANGAGYRAIGQAVP